MAQKKRQIDMKIVVGAFALLIGLPIAATAALRQTSMHNFASVQTNPDKSIPNFNKGRGITQTINEDGSMGPETFQGNYSYTQPASAKGTVSISLSDEVNTTNAIERVPSLKLSLSKAEVYLDKQKEKEIKLWETLLINNPTPIEVVNGNDAAAFGMTSLAAGAYSEVRFYINDAQATLADGSIVKVHVLTEDKTVRVVVPFTIEEGKETTLQFVLDKDSSVVRAGDTYILRPVISKIESR